MKKINRVPDGYKHFGVDKHKKELIKFLVNIITNNNTHIFDIDELAPIRGKRFFIEDTLRKHKLLSRDIQNYINYVFNFGFNENKKISFKDITGYR